MKQNVNMMDKYSLCCLNRAEYITPFHILHSSLDYSGQYLTCNLRIASCGADIYASSTRVSKEPLFKHLTGDALVKRMVEIV